MDTESKPPDPATDAAREKALEAVRRGLQRIASYHTDVGFGFAERQRLNDLRRDFEEAAGALNLLPAGDAAATQSDGWVSVRDKLPTEREWVLIYHPTDGVEHAYLSIEPELGGTPLQSMYWRCGGNNHSFEQKNPVTHWRSLPAPPQSPPAAPADVALPTPNEHGDYEIEMADIVKGLGGWIVYLPDERTMKDGDGTTRIFDTPQAALRALRDLGYGPGANADPTLATLERAVLKATGETADTLRARTLEENRRIADAPKGTVRE